MRKINLICFSLLVVKSVFGQYDNIEWQRTYGGSDMDRVESITDNFTGGFIIAGESKSLDNDVTSNKGGTDFWIVNIDSIGNIIWDKSFGGSLNERPYSITNNTDSTFTVAGYTESSDGDISINKGGADLWIIKIDTLGNLIWEKSYGGTSWEKARSIIQTKDNGFLVVGEADNNSGDVHGNHGFEDYWILKLDQNGDTLWTKSYGGVMADFPYEAIETSDSGFLVTGYTETIGDEIILPAYPDAMIIKLDKNGDLEWQKTYGGNRADVASSIIQVEDSGYVFTGSKTVDTINNQSDAWIAKIDKKGNLIWENTFGGSKNEGLSSIIHLQSGNFFALGTTFSEDGIIRNNKGIGDFWAVELNKYGKIEWQMNYGGSDWDLGSSILETEDNGYLIAGDADSDDGDVLNFKGGPRDIWLIKIKPTPYIIDQSSGIQTCEGNSDSLYVEVSGKRPIQYNWLINNELTSKNQNNLKFEQLAINDSGSYQCIVSNDMGNDTSSINEVLVFNNPIIKLGSDTTLCFGDSLMLNAGNQVSYIWQDSSTDQFFVADTSGSYYVTVVDLNGCSATDSVNIFFETCTSIIQNNNLEIKLYPNPTNGILHLETDKIEEFLLYDNTGKLLLKSAKKEIDFSGFQTGTYYLIIKYDQYNSCTNKIIYIQ